MKPKGQTEFEMRNVPNAVMSQILEYAYLRKVSGLNMENAFKLCIYADYYAVLGLLKLCTNYLIDMLDVENCVGLKEFAR